MYHIISVTLLLRRLLLRNINPLVALELKLSNHFDESEIVDIKNWPQADGSGPAIRIRRPEWESPSCASTVRICKLNLNTLD